MPERTQLHQALDEMEAAFMITLDKREAIKLFVGYFTAVEMFTQKDVDGLGVVPEPVAEFHRAVKERFGL